MIDAADAVTAISVPDGWTLVAYDVVDSTMQAARRLAEAGAAPSLLVTATEQQQGRGRRGARWLDAPGNVKLTAYVAADCLAARAAELSFVAGVAAQEALSQAAPHVDIKLKWPNDLLIGDAKVAGLLLEAGPVVQGRIAWALIGVGVNLAMAPDVRNADGPVVTTDLARFGVTIYAPVVAAMIAQRLDHWIRRWRCDGFAPILSAWRDRAAGIGGLVRVRVGDERIIGRFVDLDADGTMLLETERGGRRITAGDVALLAEPA